MDNHNDNNKPQVQILKGIDWEIVSVVTFTYMTNNYTSGVPIGEKSNKEKYDAEYIVIVEIKFNEGKIVKRVKYHSVALLDIDTLSTLLKRHHEIPLGYKEYEKLFAKGGIVNPDVLMKDRNQLIYQKEVIYSVLGVLTEERNYEVTKGLLTPRDIYLILKSDQKLNPIPSMKQIKDALDFLSSPFIRGVEELKGRYSAKGSVTEISNILNFLSG